jgi:uncharacterized protein
MTLRHAQERRLAGYAAIFDQVDRGGDIVHKGAFARAPKSVPLLWQHDAARPIGTVESLSEDARGLRVIARIIGDMPVAAGAGLSFGYRVRGMEKRTFRELTDLELIEVSVVTHPMQPLARVLVVESSEGESNGL